MTDMATQPVKKVRPGYDYKRNDPGGWCGDIRRGAAMGRHSYAPADPATWEGKLYVSRIHLDSGGYDPNGTYYGHGGDPIFWVRDATYTVDYNMNARNRIRALGIVAKEYPKATFARGPSKADTTWMNRVMGDWRQ
jgi:hypothetical protein